MQSRFFDRLIKSSIMTFLNNRVLLLLSIFYCTSFYSCSSSQPKASPLSTLKVSEGEKKVVTSGYGRNPDAALTQALRNAVEEAVGTYITSTTLLENNELIEDKILSLSRGFIKDFKKLSEIKVGGETKVTVSAIVTGTQILETLKASGIKVKVAGKKMFQQFASLDRQMEDEYRLLYGLLKYLPKEGPLNYKVEILGQPVRNGGNYELKVKVIGTINQNFKNQFSNFRNILNETAFDKKIGDFPIYKSNENGGIVFKIPKKDFRKITVRYSEDEIKNYNNLYGAHNTLLKYRKGGGGTSSRKNIDSDGMTWSKDFFKKPYSPYLIGLWTHWSDISGGRENGESLNDAINKPGEIIGDYIYGKIELYKFLDKRTHHLITKYIEDYFYDIRFQLLINFDKFEKIDLRFQIADAVRGNNYGSADTQGSTHDKVIYLLSNQGYNVSVKGITKSRFNSQILYLSPTIPLRFYNWIHLGRDSRGYYKDSWAKGSTYSAGLKWNVHPLSFAAQNYGDFRPDHNQNSFMVYKLALLPGEQPYFMSYMMRDDARSGSFGPQINQSQVANPLLTTTMTLVLSNEAFEHMESLEIKPLPVETDFIK
jgi:hypothetical protein